VHDDGLGEAARGDSGLDRALSGGDAQRVGRFRFFLACPWMPAQPRALERLPLEVAQQHEALCVCSPLKRGSCGVEGRPRPGRLRVAGEVESIHHLPVESDGEFWPSTVIS